MLYHLLFFLHVLASSVLLNVFLIVHYFINSLFKKKSVQKLTELSIKKNSKSLIFLSRLS